MKLQNKNIMNVLSWTLGIVLCTLGVSLCTKADFGISMIAAPPYILHLKLKEYFPWYSQGVSEYAWQGVLLVLLCIGLQRFKVKYVFSFLTAFVSGNVLDIWLRIFGGNAPFDLLWQRIAAFCIGVPLTSLAIAFYFRTTMPLQIYELIVTEISDKFRFDMNRVKQINDIVMLAVSIVLAVTLNRSLRGIGVGTIVITLVNAALIAFFGRLINAVCKNK